MKTLHGYVANGQDLPYVGAGPHHWPRLAAGRNIALYGLKLLPQTATDAVTCCFHHRSVASVKMAVMAVMMVMMVTMTIMIIMIIMIKLINMTNMTKMDHHHHDDQDHDPSGESITAISVRRSHSGADHPPRSWGWSVRWRGTLSSLTPSRCKSGDSPDGRRGMCHISRSRSSFGWEVGLPKQIKCIDRQKAECKGTQPGAKRSWSCFLLHLNKVSHGSRWFDHQNGCSSGKNGLNLRGPMTLRWGRWVHDEARLSPGSTDCQIDECPIRVGVLGWLGWCTEFGEDSKWM